MRITADGSAANLTSDQTRQENEIDSNLSFATSSYSSMSLLSTELYSEETWCAESCMLISVDDTVVHKQKTTKQSSEGSIKNKQTVLKKELSWSDQVGKKLVEYGVEGVVHEPNASAEPTKPAIARSRSIKSEANDIIQSSNETSRYPRPTPYDEHVKYPRTVPYDGSDLSSGAYGSDSPQWGWYTHHTTPPTPEYYHGRPTWKHGSGSSNTSSHTVSTQSSVTTTTTLGSPIPSAPQPNPVFRILQNKYKANPNAWNVPC